MQEIAKTLTWTFIHSLWQGLLAALIAAVIITSTRNATARVRYNLLGIVMILFFAGSVITFITQWSGEATIIAASSFTLLKDVEVISNTDGPMDNFIVWVNANSNIIIVIWTFFFLFSFLRLVTGLAAVNRLRHYKTHSVTTDWKTKREQLQLMIGVRYPVSLLESELAKVPMALGILKPVILLPLGLLTHLPPEQVETILLHELAHIRRRDYLINLLQHIGETIFFFNPAVRWISSLIREEREACCDDMVVAHCKQKTNYLNALVNFQEYSFGHNTPYAMGIGSKRHYLLNRVRRIITNKNKGINLFEKAGLLAGVFMFSAFCFVTKEQDVEPIGAISYQLEQPIEKLFPISIPQPQQQIAKKGNFKLINKQSRDTIPAKKNKNSNKKINSDNTRLPTLSEREQAAKNAKAKLLEIILLKDQIGARKETIGAIKEQLKTKDGKEKEKFEKELKKERDELDKQRKVLDKKRYEWDNLKEKAKEKQIEQKPADAYKKIIYEKSPTIEKDDAKQWDKSDQWDKSAGYDKSDAWDEHDGKKLGARIKSPEQEYEYKIGLPRRDPRRVKEAPPENLRKPGTPAKRASPVRPSTGN